ncbi:hypothetical protein Tco_1300438 [Tanacetum coccineum]
MFQAPCRETRPYLADFQDFNGGPVAFEIVKAYFYLVKGKIKNWGYKFDFEKPKQIVKGNLVRGLPTKLFLNGPTLVLLCQKRKATLSFLLRPKYTRIYQNTGTKDKLMLGDSRKRDDSNQDCFELPLWHSYSPHKTPSCASKSDNNERKNMSFWMILQDFKGQEKGSNECKLISQEES